MKSNGIVKIIAIGAVTFLLIVLVISKKSGEQEAEIGAAGPDLTEIDGGPELNDNGLEFDPLRDDYLENEYGVDVDSPVETMRTLTKETRAVREDSEALQEANRQMGQQVDQLLKMEERLQHRVGHQLKQKELREQEVQREIDAERSEMKGLIDELKARMEALSATGSAGSKSAAGYEIDASGIPSGLGYDESGFAIDFDEIVWSNPIDAKVDARSGEMVLPDFSAAALEHVPESIKDPTGRQRDRSKEERSIKAYTIPENSTLIGSVSMTALLGRIPTKGAVQDPYPFKVMVGEENLSSNGIDIPGVVGIKMSGIAKGDWTLSCVSGEIHSMTFTFRDGTIQTIPEPGTKANDPLAWFSDHNGIPCVTGKRITNAATYLASRIGLSAASSYASAEAQSQLTTTSTGDSTQTSLTGDPMVFAKNTAISDGINEATDWLDERQESSFDAIYVPPGTELAIHVTEELKIDYDPEGRKVNHYADLEPHSHRYLD